MINKKTTTTTWEIHIPNNDQQAYEPKTLKGVQNIRNVADDHDIPEEATITSVHYADKWTERGWKLVFSLTKTENI